MKKAVMLLITMMMTFALTGCGGNSGSKVGTTPNAKVATPSESSQVKPAGEKTGKILIAYYSRTGNTRSVAQEIQKNVGGDLFEIKTTNSYPEEYKAATEQAKTEKNNNFRFFSSINYSIFFIGQMPHSIYCAIFSYNNFT